MRSAGKIGVVVALAVSGVATTTWLVSCVGDATTGPGVGNDAASGDAPGVGGEGEPCYGNGSCNGALTCVSKVCVNLQGDAAADGGVASDGASSNEAGVGDAAGDANDPCVSGNVHVFDSGTCFDGGFNNYLCGSGTPTCQPLSNCPASTPAFQCVLSSDCAQGRQCCAGDIYLAQAPPTVCPFAGDPNMNTSCVLAGGAGPGGCTAQVDYPTCKSDSECKGSGLGANGVCRPVTFNNGTLAIGVCHP